ncbi:MAG: purine-binding chemotaxis protein CheW [Gammaproteobacteria bacterium]|nr:MAG: purine-binding chemotaxis protein CheW [Gammaproteobacteria bacterium]
MGGPDNNPLEQLLDYDRRGKQYIVDLTDDEQKVEYWRGVVFRVESSHFALEEFEVTELLYIPAAASIPGTKRWVKGMANVRGELLPLIDFNDFLFQKPLEDSKSSRVLVVNSGDVRSGLMVDQVFGIRRFIKNTLQETLPDELPAPIKMAVNGFYKEDEQVIAVLSVRKLVEETEFMQAAA